MAEEKTIIARSNPEDLNSIVLLYERYMFESYLIQLGRGYIENYLSYIIKSQDCVTLIAKNDRIVGFIMAALNSRKFFYGLVFQADQILFQSIYFLKHPVKYFRILELLFYPF
ncbi:MAG: hypothetical protein PHQ54_04775 [Candidatus Omnitrophica bacterium]|nr:hypothetical protein [Candidatus Omnitrophota bacterium]